MNRKQHFRTHVQGESLENKIQTLSDKNFEYLVLPMVAFVACMYIWMIYLDFLKVDLFTAVFITVLMIVLSLRAFFKIKKLCKQIRNHRKGLDGERYVGAIIEKLHLKIRLCFTILFAKKIIKER